MPSWKDIRKRRLEREEELLKEYQDMFWDDTNLKQTISKVSSHPQIPYLQRLLNTLNQLATNTPTGFGITHKIPREIIEERNKLRMRINNIMNGDIQSEIIFLEGEIKILNSRKTNAQNILPNIPTLNSNNQGVNDLLGVLGNLLSNKVSWDGDQTIAQHQRDIEELKAQTANALLTGADPAKQKLLDEIDQIEKEIKANEDTILQIEQLNIPDADKKRDQNIYQNEINALQLKLLRVKNQLAKL